LRERYLDHIEPVEGIGLVGRIGSVLATGQLGFGPSVPIAGEIDIDDALVVGLGITVWVWDPLQLCTFFTSFGVRGFDTS